MTLGSRNLDRIEDTEMTQRTWAVVAAAVIVSVMFNPDTARSQSAETGAVQQTAWGRPDLQGVWDFRTITPMERPEELGDQAFLTAEEAANLEQEVVDRNARLLNEAARRTEAGGNVGAYNNFWMDRGTRTVDSRRTSLIIDPPNGQIPPYTTEGQQRADARTEYRQAHPADSWADRSVGERCVLGFNSGPPMEPRAYNNHMQIFQTSDYVVILNEMVHDARVIPLVDAEALPGTVTQWMGHSRGHWEDDTLVIHTTNFYNKNSFTERHGATTGMRLVERFTRNDANTLVYQYTVDDAATWTSPWTVEVPMARSDDQLWEYACHEGNYGMDGILAGHRAEEREATEAQ